MIDDDAIIEEVRQVRQEHAARHQTFWSAATCRRFLIADASAISKRKRRGSSKRARRDLSNSSVQGGGDASEQAPAEVA
ncbi:MAG: hypothetical protein ABJC13_20835 [Acidobacteriota bacterium]